MNNNLHSVELGSVAYVTKLAGFEHTEYIQPNATKKKVNSDDVPMIIGLNIKNGTITGNTHWYLPKKLSETLSRSALTKKCIVLPYVGSVGDLAVFDGVERHHLASNVAKIELLDNAPFSTEYLYYYLKSPFGQRQLLYYIQGGVQKNITMDAIRKTKVNIISNESAVVKLLSELDQKIDLNNKISIELERIARLLFDYWFVQYDFPDIDGRPYMSSGGKMVYSGNLKREIPAEWSDGVLSDIADITMGQSPPGSTYNEAGQGFIFFQGCTDFGVRFPKVRQYTTSPTRYALKGDILLSVRAPVGELNIAPEHCCIGRGLSALRSKNNSIAYLLGVMRNFKQIFDRRNADGTTFGAITKDDLHTLKVVVPPADILKRYQMIADPIFEQQDIIAKENQLLVELRDWLLPMLMNGQVEVITSAGADLTNPSVNKQPELSLFAASE